MTVNSAINNIVFIRPPPTNSSPLIPPPLYKHSLYIQVPDVVRADDWTVDVETMSGSVIPAEMRGNVTMLHTTSFDTYIVYCLTIRCLLLLLHTYTKKK